MPNFVEISRFERYLRTHSAFSSQNKPDYSYKSSILSKGLDREFNSYKLQEHYNFMSINNFDEDYGLYIPQCCDSSSLNYWFDDLAHRFGFCAILEARRILNANYHRLSRLKSRIYSILSCNSLNCYFVTLTFTNNVLSKTSSYTRRLYVTRFLKSVSFNYVANIDFGSKNGREHFHAVLSSEFLEPKLWKYGRLDYEIISKSQLSIDKLSLYVSKLTNHAIKKTTKRTSLIYPKFTRTTDWERVRQ